MPTPEPHESVILFTNRLMHCYPDDDEVAIVCLAVLKAEARLAELGVPITTP